MLADGQHGGRLSQSEGQLRSPYLGESALHPQPPQPQPWVGPGQHHHLDHRGQQVEEPAQQLTALGRPHKMAVLHDDRRSLTVGQRPGQI